MVIGLCILDTSIRDLVQAESGSDEFPSLWLRRAGYLKSHHICMRKLVL